MASNSFKFVFKKTFAGTALFTMLLTQSSCDEACRILATLSNVCFDIAFPALWWLPIGPGAVVGPACDGIMNPRKTATASLNYSAFGEPAPMMSSKTGMPITEDEVLAYAAEGYDLEAAASEGSCQGETCDPKLCCEKLKEARPMCESLSNREDKERGISPRDACIRDLDALIAQQCPREAPSVTEL